MNTILLWIAALTSVGAFGAMIWFAKRTARIIERKETELVEKTPALMLQALQSKELRTGIQELMLDQEFMQATASTIFESLKAGIYGLVGFDKKQEKKLGEALKTDLVRATPIGQFLEMLPENSKFGNMLKANPEMVMQAIKLFAPTIQGYINQQQQY